MRQTNESCNAGLVVARFSRGIELATIDQTKHTQFDVGALWRLAR
jgi:hypothetical protein